MRHLKKKSEVLNQTFEKEEETMAKDGQDSTLETLDGQDITLETLDDSKNNSRFVEFMDKDDEEEVNFRASTSRRTRSLDKAPVTPSPIAIKSVARKSVGGAKLTPRNYLSGKNKTPLRKTSKTPGSIQKKAESQIPRFVKFAQKGKIGKIPDF